MNEVIAILPQLLDQRRRRVKKIRFIGDSAADKGDLEGAADAYRATAAICERFLAHPPEDFELRFAHLAVVDELGITLMKGDTKQREEGREAVRRAHQMLNDLDSKDPGNRDSRRSVRDEIEGHLKMR